MPEYTFDTLSPLDFEFLVRDLLQKKLDCHIESFKTGKDGGIDLRIAKAKQKPWIIQCKRYVESSFSKLKSEVKKELPKIKRLNPERYFLCTALNLLPQHKDELQNLLQPFSKSTDDIFGNECLNNLLGQFPEIERKHMKLWLCSEGVLQRVLKSQIFNRTALTTEDIKHRISMFVPTTAVDRSMRVLRKNGFCLIAGIPGIGKTTTAEILLSMHVDDGWTPITVTNAAQAVEALSSSEKQIVYYDDFLGQTSIDEKLSKNEEDDITRLVKHCSRRPKHTRFILTTREYLFEQASHVHEKLRRARLDIGKCTIRLEDYTNKIRAEILLNHLYFYDVPQKVRSYLVEKKIAKKIVDHPNYNPRVIEETCEEFRRNKPTPAKFGKAFLAFLDDPSSIWNSAYESQLSQDAKELLICFASIGGMTDIESMEEAYQAFSSAGNDPLNFSFRFRQALKELDGCFLNSIGLEREIVIFQFHNPSVKDFTDTIINTDSITNEIVQKSVFHCQITNDFVWKSTDPVDLADAVLRVVSSPEPTYFNVSDYYSPNSWSLAERICLWSDRCGENEHFDELLKQLAIIGEEHLLGEPDDDDSTKSLVGLFQFVLKQRGGGFKYSVKNIYSRLVGSIDECDQFLDLEIFLADLQDHERDELGIDIRKEFKKFADKELEVVAQDPTSSSAVTETIENVLTTLTYFQMNESELNNLDEAEEALAEITEQEEMEADSYNEDYQIQRASELASEAELNNILDAFRE